MEFKYTAKNESGQIQSGIISASDADEATANLQKQNLFVSEIKSAKGGFSLKDFGLSKKVSLKDKIIFTDQLAMMIKGGLPLVDALKALREQAENPTFAIVLGKITDDVNGGMTLSKAIAKHPKIFPELYTSIISSGERSGKLDEVLVRLTNQLQKDYDLIAKIKGATTYPIVIVCALIGMMILMLVFVVPQLQKIFSEMGVALPLPTRILIGLSSFLVHFWYLVIAIIIGLVLGVRFYMKTENGLAVIDKIKIGFPLFGKIAKKIYIARFARTTATLVTSGLPMLEILETDKGVMGNSYFRPILTTIGKDVESGIPLSTAMKKHKIFPVMIPQMISVGEKSGKVDQVLFHLADFYDKEVEAATANMASLIEPILIIVIGAGIGVAIVSIIMPIYSLVNVI